MSKFKYKQFWDTFNKDIYVLKDWFVGILTIGHKCYNFKPKNSRPTWTKKRGFALGQSHYSSLNKSWCSTTTQIKNSTTKGYDFCFWGSDPITIFRT